MKIFKNMKRFFCVCAAMTTLFSSAAWAGEWQQMEEGSWKYEEAGVYVTGWQQIEGVWYYLNPETELWEPSPDLDQTSVCYLLENAVNKAGWYRNEENHIVYKIDSSDSYQYIVSLMQEKEPHILTNTLNTFSVSKKTGLAKSLHTKEVLNLYE